ncbi:MAG: aldo/keto reductase [Nitrosotalea sp.]
MGTVQIGVRYGIANKSGKPNFQSAQNILQSSVLMGINAFDTAATYGNSEEIIGSFLKKISLEEYPIIITKIPKIQAKNVSFENIYQQVKSSVVSSATRLNLDQIPICLLHEAGDMISYDGLVTKSLVKLKEEGFVKMIGASIYSPTEAKKFLEIDEFEVIQIPINIFDTRLLKQGILDEFNQRKTIVFARSIFLQGLIFLKLEKLPSFLASARIPLEQFYDLSSDLGMNPAQLALTFVRDTPGITSMVLGVETVNQLNENVKLIDSPHLSDGVRCKIIDMFCDTPEEIVNPSKWNIKEE